jgi:hypothetical protein
VTVIVAVAVLVIEPDLPVTVSVSVPVFALFVTVTVNVPVVAGEVIVPGTVGVTPVVPPVTLNAMGLVKAPTGVTLTV